MRLGLIGESLPSLFPDRRAVGSSEFTHSSDVAGTTQRLVGRLLSSLQLNVTFLIEHSKPRNIAQYKSKAKSLGRGLQGVWSLRTRD